MNTALLINLLKIAGVLHAGLLCAGALMPGAVNLRIVGLARKLGVLGVDLSGKHTLFIELLGFVAEDQAEEFARFDDFFDGHIGARITVTSSGNAPDW